MTQTTNERDRFEAWAKDTMSLVKEPGGYKEATTHHAWRAWQAALTREQREGVQRPSQGWYRARIMESLDHEPCVAGGGWVRFVCSNPERRHPHASDPQGPCPSCVAEGVGNWSCITLAAFAGSQPQQEAQGAAAFQHKWDDAGETCVHCGDKDWMGDKCSGPRTATPPAPVDVPVNDALLYALEQRDAEIARLEAKLAILDGQPAGVDDAMVERLAKHIVQQESRNCSTLDESLHHQSKWRRAIPEARAALEAALGGGGRG